MKKNAKYIAMITAIVVVIASVLGAVIFIYGGLSGKKNEEMDSGFYVRIRSDSKENYTIIVPVVVGKKGNLAEFMNSVKVLEGNGSIEIVNTSHGMGMEIKGNGNLYIYGMEDILFKDGRFSMMHPYNGSLGPHESLWRENLTMEDYELHTPVIGNTTMFCAPYEGNISLSLSYWYYYGYEEGGRCKGYHISWKLETEKMLVGWNEYVFRIHLGKPAC